MPSGKDQLRTKQRATCHVPLTVARPVFGRSPPFGKKALGERITVSAKGDHKNAVTYCYICYYCPSTTKKP